MVKQKRKIIGQKKPNKNVKVFRWKLKLNLRFNLIKIVLQSYIGKKKAVKIHFQKASKSLFRFLTPCF